MVQNTLMFEVGVGLAEEQFKKIKADIDSYVGQWQKDLNIKVKIENLQELTNQLRGLGDSQGLRTLRSEIEALNKEFAKLAVGAGGSGSLGERGIKQQIESNTQSIERYRAEIEKLTNARSKLTGGKLHKDYDTMTSDIAKYETRIEGATNRIAELKAQLENLGKGGSSAAPQLDKTTESATIAEQTLNAMKTQMNGVNTAVKTLAENMTILVKKMGEMNTAPAPKIAEGMQQSSETTKQLTQDIENLKRKLNFGEKDKLFYQEEIRGAAEELKKMGLSWRDIGDSSKIAAGAEQTYLAILKEEEAMTQRIAEARRQMGREATLSQLGGTKADREFYLANRGIYDTSGNVWERISELESLKRKKIGSYIEEYDVEMDAKLKKDIENELRYLQQHIREAIMRMLRMGGNIDNIDAYGRSDQSNFGESIDNRIEKIRDKIDEKIRKMIDDYEKRIQQKFSREAYYTFGEKEEHATMKQGVLSGAKYYAETLEDRKRWVQETNEENKALQQQIAEKEKLIQANNQNTVATEKATQAAQQLVNVESKPAQGGILDPKQFTALQEAISQVVKEVTRLGEALSGLKLGNLSELTTAINTLHHNATTASDAMKAIDTGAKFNKSEAEVAAYEKRVKELQEQIKNLEAQAKNTAEAVKKVNNEFKSVSEKSGSEDTKNRNLDVLKAHIKEVYEAMSRMAKEYSRLENEKAFDANLKAKIDNLRAYHEWLLKVQNGQVDLSKAGALKSTEAMFKSGTAIGDVTLMGKVAKQWYSEKEIKSFGKMVDDVIGRKQAVDSLGESFERLKQKVLGVGTAGTGGMRGFSANMDILTVSGQKNIQALLKARGQINQYIEKAQKSLTVSQGTDVMGMSALRGQQEANIEYLKRLRAALDYIYQFKDQPAWIRFLNDPNAFKIPLPGNQNDVALLGAHYTNLKRSVSDTQRAIEQLKKARGLESDGSSKVLAQELALRKQIANQTKAQAEASMNARREMLQGQGKELQQLLSLGSGRLGVEQYEAVRNALRAIREELRQIETMTQRGGLSSNILSSMGSGRNYAGIISSAQAVVGMKEKAVTATNQLADAERRFGEVLMQSTNQMQKQSQVLSDLKMMALQYVSVWGAQSFINNIIDQGGQLEQQRLSIQAILGDAAHAQTLFNQVKALAIKSPFGVTQIDQMTKQLSAYGFQYSELFDLTKRLADISAATGTEVSRLALALGHVKSEAALSGYTLRQFSMANVPLLTKLTEKLGVSAKEVRNMVRKKEIGYDIVLEILKELTDESGMFYNAQETMSEALNAKFKNLRDSFQIMYSEMAEGAPGDFLKGVAVALTEMSKNWKTLIPMIGVGAAAFVSLRLSTMALNKGFAVTGSLMKGNAIAASQYTMAQLRLMVAQRQVLRTTGLLNVALAGIGSVFKRIGSFIFNPVNLGITALFAAVEGLVYAWQRHNQEMEKAKSLTTGFGQEGSEGAKNLTERLNQTGTSSGKNSSELKQGIDSMTSTLRDYGVDVGKIMNDAFGTDANGKVRSLAEQYDYLRGKMAETLDVYRELERTKGAFEYGINSTNDGIFDDDVNTNLTQYAEAVKTLDATIADFYGKYGDDIDKAVEKAVDSDKNFAKATENMKNNAEKFREYVLKPLDYPSASETMNESLSKTYSLDRMNINEAYGKLSETKEMAMKELDDFFENTEKYYETKGYDFEALTAIEIDNLMKQSREYLKLHPEWSAIMDDLKRKFEERWPIKIDITPESSTDKLSDWQQQMQDWLNAHKLKELIQIKGDMSREDIIKLIHEKLKEAQNVVDNTSPILLRFGVSLDNVPEPNGLPQGLQTPWGKHQAADYKTNRSNILGLNDFLKEFDLPAPKDKNKTKAKKEDKEAKELRERVRILKEAADSYQYWRKAVGDNGAVTHVNDEFGKLLSEQKFSFENVKKFRETLTALRKEYEKKPKTKAMLEALKELDKIFADLDRKDFEKKSDDFLSTIQIELDTLTRAWDIFNKVREATGDVELAVTLSGVNVKSGTETLADALKNKIRKDFAEAGGVGDIIFDSNMSDKDVQRLFENAIPQGAKESAKQYEERIKGIVEEYTKWRDLQRDVTSKDIDVFSKLIGSAVDLQTRIQLINNEFMTTMQSLDRLRAEGRISSDEYNRASSMESANHQMKLVQASDTYQMLMDGIVTMNKKAARTIRKDFINALDAQLKAGTITAKDYADKIHEVNEKMQDLEKAPSMFQSYMQGGLDGLFKNMDTQGRAKSYQGGQKIQDAQKMIDSSFGEGGSFEMFQQGISKMANGKEMAQIGQGMSQMSGQMAQTVAIIDMIVHGIDNIVQGLNDTYGEIKDMYTALGENTESDGWQDSSTFFSSFSKASASATKGWDSLKNGDVGGVMSGVVGSFTNWVTGFAQGHDAKREQHIEDLKFEVSKIDNTLEKIRSMRERELGYDSGTIRRIMSERYSREALASSTPVEGLYLSVGPNVSQAMADYYNQSSIGTGYRQELELIKAERQKYIDMYTEEAESKNSSEEALEEYKNKIAELDEKIMYFAEDLGKELWGLDLKGWADQIGDALMTAFENGEDAMEAFNATAKDIVRSVVSEMIKLDVIQPMMKDLRKALFGEEGAEPVIDENGDKWRGVYNETKGTFDQDKTLSIMGQYFGEDGILMKIPDAYKQAYELAQKATGMDLSSDESGSTSSKIIQGGFTEDETGMLLSYVNSIRADVSINRDLLMQYLPSLQAAMTAGNASLQTIASNTTAIMRSNESINNNVIDLRSDIRGLKNGTWKMPMA